MFVCGGGLGGESTQNSHNVRTTSTYIVLDCITDTDRIYNFLFYDILTT
jgi:hypothetical protein